MSRDEPDVHMRLLSQPRLLASVRSLLTSLAERIGFGEVESGHVALAVDEALANIIRHGYEKREDELIELSVWVLNTPKPGIKIMIEDEAPQVDPEAIQGRDLDNVQPGGLGVHIMREVMDTCHFERRDNRGMRVTMQKTLDRSSSDSSHVATTQKAPESG